MLGRAVSCTEGHAPSKQRKRGPPNWVDLCDLDRDLLVTRPKLLEHFAAKSVGSVRFKSGVRRGYNPSGRVETLGKALTTSFLRKVSSQHRLRGGRLELSFCRVLHRTARRPADSGSSSWYIFSKKGKRKGPQSPKQWMPRRGGVCGSKSGTCRSSVGGGSMASVKAVSVQKM